MLEDFQEGLRWALGEVDGLQVHEMALRAVLIYVAALIMVRWGEKRFLGKSTAFDVLLAIILGSVVSRAITGQSPLLPTLVAGVVLVGMHWLLAKISFRSNALATAIKGDTRILIRDGEIDLLAALRINGRTNDPAKVKEAPLERNGDISVIPAAAEPRIVRAELDGGELTVTVELRR